MGVCKMKYHYFVYAMMSLIAFWYLGIQFKELCTKERRMLDEWESESKKHKHTHLAKNNEKGA
jgi:hypothetical protein